MLYELLLFACSIPSNAKSMVVKDLLLLLQQISEFFTENAAVEAIRRHDKIKKRNMMVNTNGSLVLV